MAARMTFIADQDIVDSDLETITVCTEENELLNSRAIKMTEPPFGRTDSEEEILDDLEDDINYSGTCCKGRTALERLLLILIFILLIVIIGLAVGLTRPQVIPRKEYCKTTQCVQAASSILEAMDPYAQPCSNFFQYACGGWEQKNPIPKGYHKWDRVQELAGQNLYVLKNLIETSVTLKSEAENKTRAFYKSCMKTGSANYQDVLLHFKRLVEQVGGWSITPSAGSSRWYLVTVLEKIHRLGAWPLFKVKVDVDERDPTRRYIVKVDFGETVLPLDMYRPLQTPPTQAPPTTQMPAIDSPDGYFVNDTYNKEEDHPSFSVAPTPSTTEGPPTSTTATTTTTTTTTESPAEIAERVKRMFVEETVHILQALGFNSSLALKRAQLMADLEMSLVVDTEDHVHGHDRFSLYNVLTVEELETNFSMFSWTQYFNTLGFKVSPAEEVVVLHPQYMGNLTSQFNALRFSPGSTNVFRDYMIVILVRSFKQYFDLSVFDMENSDNDWMQEQWKRCTFYTNKAMGFATGAMFVRGNGQENTVQRIEDLISYVRSAFKDFILRKFWIDHKTRLKAEQKVDNIINKISYPSYILNVSFLDKYYKGLLVHPEKWFENLLNWRQFELHRQNAELLSAPDRQKSWVRPPVTVKAVYSPNRNDVIFPIAMFHLPYYIPDGPAAVNFGAMGSVIGHEITHAFDFQGRQYDEEGRLRDWWDPHSTHNFGVTTQCMVHQYSDIDVQGHTVDGEFTLDENIADNGGMRAAHYAYMKWLEAHGEEPPLPSLNLTNHQVFFLSYAQMYCSKWSESGLKLHLLTDPHSPGAARVNGVLANSKTFSWAFKCPVFSKMNAQTKCEVW